MRTRSRFITAGSAVLVGIALTLGIGGAAGIGNDGPDGLALSVLDQPAAPEMLPEHVRTGGHPGFDVEEVRYAGSAGAHLFFVAPGSGDLGPICLLRVDAVGSSASTCGDASVDRDYGGIPLVSVYESGDIDLAAIVPDGLSSAVADDGSEGQIQSNVAFIRVDDDAELVTFSGEGESRTMDVGIWRND